MNKHFKWVLTGLLTLAFIIIFAPFFTEILMAGIFAFALDPLLKKIAHSKWVQTSSIYFKRKQWVALILSTLTLAITLPIFFAVYSLYDSINEAATDGFQNSDFYKDIIHTKAIVIQYADQIIGGLNLKRKVDLIAISDHYINELGRHAITLSGKAISQLPELLMYIFVFCCALYFFLAEHRSLRSIFIKSRMVAPAEMDRLIEIFQKSCSSTLFASFVTGFIQATIVSLGSALLKVGDFFVIFVVTFFLSFIPVVGAAPVALFLAFLSLIKMNYGSAIALVVVSVIAGTIDNILRPVLVSSGDDVHPVVVLLGLIGAIIIFGIPGLFLGPVIATVTVQLYTVYVLSDNTSQDHELK